MALIDDNLSVIREVELQAAVDEAPHPDVAEALVEMDQVAHRLGVGAGFETVVGAEVELFVEEFGEFV